MSKNKEQKNPVIQLSKETIAHVNEIIDASLKNGETKPLKASFSFNSESASELFSISEALNGLKIKPKQGAYKNIQSVRNGLDYQIKKLGIDSFYEWYMTNGKDTEIEIDSSFKPNEGVITKGGIILPNYLTTEQQMTFASLLARKMLDEKRHDEDSYEYQNTIPLIIRYMLHHGNGMGEESLKRIIIGAQQDGKEYVSLLTRLARFSSLRPGQIDELAISFMRTQASLISTNTVLELIELATPSPDILEQKNKKSEEPTSTLSSSTLRIMLTGSPEQHTLNDTLRGALTTTEFLQKSGIERANATALPKRAKGYVLEKVKPYTGNQKKD